MKKLIALSMILALAACSDEPTPEQKSYVNAMIPGNCEFIDLGKYAEIDRLVFIMCKGNDTVSTNLNHTYKSGKTTKKDNLASFVIE